MSNSARLRKVGGSVVMAIPPNLLQEMKLKTEDVVTLTVSDGKLLVEPVVEKGAYSLKVLLAEEAESRTPSGNSDWTLDSPTGRELL